MPVRQRWTTAAADWLKRWFVAQAGRLCALPLLVVWHSFPSNAKLPLPSASCLSTLRGFRRFMLYALVIYGWRVA